MRITRSVLALSFVSILMTSASVTAFAQDDERMAGTKPDTEQTIQDNSNTYEELNLFGDVFERVRAQYVDKVGDEELVESAINGMLVSLDPHSAYLDNDDFEEMQVQTKGEFGGLGIEVTMENGIIKVVSPIDDTPAFRAGVKAGDYITHIDDEPIVGMTLSDAVDKMRGEVGTNIKITVRRKDVSEALDFDIIRDVIKIESTRYDTLDDAVGYIRITAFNQNTDVGVKKGVKEIKEKLGNNLKGYVIDLRNNPGGLLNQAISVSDLFLDKGEIVSTRGRHEEDTKRDNATSGDIAEGLPIVVLINGGSASAAEIVSGALQDHRRAILMGEQSFGKGSVQTIIPLPGHGAMRLTTARYYTPSGRSIQAKGIEPDIMVDPAKIEQLDVQYYHESDLRGALVNENDLKKKGDDKTSEAKDTKDQKNNKTVSGDENKEEDQKMLQDYQLSRAVDLIRGVSLYKSRLNDLPADITNQGDSEKGSE